MTRTTCRLLHEHEAQNPDHRNRVAARVEERRNAPTRYVLSAAMYQRLIDAVKLSHVHVAIGARSLALTDLFDPVNM